MGWLASSGDYVPLVLVCGAGMLLVTAGHPSDLALSPGP